MSKRLKIEIMATVAIVIATVAVFFLTDHYGPPGVLTADRGELNSEKGDTQLDPLPGAGTARLPGLRKLTAIRLTYVGARATPEGCGFVYCRGRNASVGQSAVRFEVTDWSSHIANASLPEWSAVAAVIDGLPMKAVGTSLSNERGVWDVKLSDADEHLVEALDSAGAPIDGLRVSSSDLFHIGRVGDTAHPGIVYRDQMLIQETGSPFWISAAKNEPTMCWVGSPGHTFRDVILEPHVSSFHQVQLGPAGELDFEIRGAADPGGLVLKVDLEDGAEIVTGPLYQSVSHQSYERILTLSGLPPGPARIQLVPTVDPRGTAVAASTVDIVEGSKTSLQLVVDSDEQLRRGALVGSLALPERLPPNVALSDVLLVARAVVRYQGDPIAGGGSLSLQSRQMHESGDSSHLYWDMGSCIPGGYLLEVQPLGVLMSTWVDPAVTTSVDIVVTEMSEFRISFVDSESGESIDVELLSAHREWESSGQTGLTTLIRAEYDSGSHVLRFHGSPGPLTLAIRSASHGTHWHQAEVLPGVTEQVRSLPLSRWLDLEFVRQVDSTRVGTRWYGSVEIWSGAEPLPISWQEFGISEDGGTVVSLCVPRREVSELRFDPEDGFVAIPRLKLGDLSASFRTAGMGNRDQVEVVLRGVK
ncbi:MAG TPA: hypothetical protein EYQ74_09100 [Planctomycetes bacterium]|nr:hypothetical protein [Planctomycetota bacterium]HIK60043.1 hypothetical protein [Planctomycetota bacterium]